MADSRQRSLRPVEVRGVTAPDGRPGVLLQLPDGYMVMNPEDAAHLAGVLVEVAGQVTGGERDVFTCPACDTTSYHPKDVEQGYCARCHAWTGERS